MLLSGQCVETQKHNNQKMDNEMKKEFKLTNLRELSTEEQQRLNGGLNTTGCGSCTCTCRCTKELNDTKSSTDDSLSYNASSQFT